MRELDDAIRFPIGPAALYEAILEKGHGFERTRRVFTRTGELAYLMLSRASEPLRARIRESLALSFDPDTFRYKLILRLISSVEPDRGIGRKCGAAHLPHTKNIPLSIGWPRTSLQFSAFAFRTKTRSNISSLFSGCTFISTSGKCAERIG